MIMRSPIVAMLWENWQLTRLEAVQRLALGLVVGSAVLLWLSNGATVAFWVLIVLHGMFVWLSILKLNGGRFMDGYKPGFPFFLLYPRPVSTSLFVGVAMAYDALTCLALYLASAALLGLAFGQPLPLFSVALWIVAFHFCYTCVQWATPSRVVQWVGSMAFGWPLFFLLMNSVESPLQIKFSMLANAGMVLLCAVAFVLTVAGVSRQRRGDAVADAPQAAGSGGYPAWLINFFRFTCPTTSATRAQVWFDLKSSGLPVLAIGFGVALLIFLLFAISIPVPFVRFAAIGISFFSIPVVLFHLGGNAFGIRRKQGRAYASSFEVTQPYVTAHFASLKVLVRAACVLTALITIIVSVWASSSLMSAWGAWSGWVVEDGKNAVPELLQARQKLADAFGGLTGYAHAALALVIAIVLATVVAWQSAREALRVRYPRLVMAADWLPIVWGLGIMLVALAGQKGLIAKALMTSIVFALIWLAAAVIALLTIYLAWLGLAGRSLSIRYACGAVLIWVIFAAAWVTALNAGGIELGSMPVSNALTMVWPVLLPLFASVLAPWALSRVRHI